MNTKHGVLPIQVRPKTQIPDSLPHSPFQEQQSSQQALSLQRATALVSPKSQGPALVSPKSKGPALPTANSTFIPERLPNGQGGDSSPPLPPPPPPLPPQLQALSVGGGASPSTAPAATSTGPGVAYAIVSGSPPASAPGNGLSGAGEAVKVQPLLFSADNKVSSGF